MYILRSQLGKRRNDIKINSEKWVIAQKGEKNFWTRWIQTHSSDDIWLNKVLKYFHLKQNQDFGKKILVDIGSGPIGILTKLKAEKKIAIDPLSIESFSETVERIKALGEKIPLSNESIDCIFIYNVLQHVIFPEKVLEEGTRILKQEGIFYILEQLNLPTDELHLHSLKLEMFEKWILKNNLKIIEKKQEKDCSFRGQHSEYSILCLILKK